MNAKHRAIQGVGLDFGFTLVTHRFSPEECLQQVCAARLEKWIEAEAIASRRPPAFIPHRYLGSLKSPINLATWYHALLNYYTDWLMRLDLNLAHPHLEDAARWVVDLYEAPENWLPQSGSDAFLSYCRAQELKLGILSNWGSNLGAILEHLRWRQRFVVVLNSIDTGWLKPNISSFVEFSRQMDLSPSAILFIGDGYETDYLGAYSSGMPALWFANLGMTDNVPRDTPRVTTWLEAIGYLEQILD